MKQSDTCSLAAPAIDKRLSNLKFHAGLLAVAMLALGLGRANAEDNNWVRSSGNTYWTNAANWSAGVVPTAANDVYFLSNSVALVAGTTAANANNLNIDTGGVKVGSIAPGTLSVAGHIAVGSPGSAGSLTLSSGTISANTIDIVSTGTYSDNARGTVILTGDGAGFGLEDGVKTVVNSEIQGTNGMLLRGSGTVVLANDNTYTGGTTNEEGNLVIGNGGKSGSLGGGHVANNRTMVFNRSDTYTYTNETSGTGNLVQAGSGETDVTGANSYSGGTTVSNGTLRVIGTGSLGSGDITNYNKLIFSLADTVLSNQISGTGSLIQISNTLTLIATNTYTGVTKIETNSTLQVGDGAARGTLGTGDIVNDGELIINHSDTYSVSNQISGKGNLSVGGAGKTILTSDNPYEGSTSIDTDTILQVGDGGRTGTLGNSNVFNYGTLIFNRTNAYTVKNTIEGTGSLVQAGNSNSILTLTASNSYGGGTFVTNGGTLVVGTNFALGTGDLTVNNGTIEAAGTGETNKIIINVGGNFTNGVDGTVKLAVGGTESNGATNQYDQLRIAGTADLDGTLHVVGADGYTPHHLDQQTLLTALGGVTNTFATFTNEITHSVLVEARLDYGLTNVVLSWDQLSFTNYLTTNNIKLTRNQKAVGRALDTIATSTSSNDVTLIDHLDYLSDLTNDLPAAFDQIAPEELTSMLVASFAIMDAQGKEFLNRARELRTDYQTAYTAEMKQRAPFGMRISSGFDELVNKPWDLYFNLPYSVVKVAGDDNANGYDITSSGINIGGDRRFGGRMIAGGALGYATSKSDLTAHGSLDLEAFNAQVYGIWVNEGLHFDGMVGGNVNRYKTKRTAVEGIAKGNADGVGWTALLGGGYDWVNGPWKFGPQVAFQYMSVSINEFTEKGSLSPLRVLSQTEDAMNSQLGLNLRYRHVVNDSWTIITPEAYFGWRHDYTGNSVSLESKFASGAGDTFTVKGPELGSDSILATLGFTVQWLPSFNTFFNYSTQRGRSGYTSRNFNLGARLSF